MGGYISSLFSQGYPPKPKWKPDDIPDLSQKVFLITGANTGIGTSLWILFSRVTEFWYVV
ncbi:hypothetical protein BS47DRAFT_1344762 [Hydnum rufescens UP504]|uniref:Uncharacterized protein n=1 Tax=Hydnum rufescens UP504 TaxID=1448309 RepID=A0A9P6AX93_9AGAM|nr:hypothetical protein BS47DRAFT_1344762 [Hydnum rufescens UP504]